MIISVRGIAQCVLLNEELLKIISLIIFDRIGALTIEQYEIVNKATE